MTDKHAPGSWALTTSDLLAEVDQCALELEEAANILDGQGMTSLASVYRQAVQRARAAIARAESRG